MCKNASREPFGKVMVDSGWEHKPEQWEKKTQNSVEQYVKLPTF